ncbi:hypothetical protein M409DRAFT_60301 [Zasmidium cellare ATCC 36951]|uniref:Uncharacterized protein n=1 Tax=Zasmidium cellare ATCC 36951 TaxID=1080233 RepID=A0A6A6BZJ4_ZASCE|nr:uncharacterized protein M409DRAFT_60301 [Zasmidium cellare ATCC 36951]KAF2160043.1 hypothetical protein M409DRAFT_60301 [Zasmidium cellare ATCC 36951]
MRKADRLGYGAGLDNAERGLVNVRGETRKEKEPLLWSLMNAVLLLCDLLPDCARLEDRTALPEHCHTVALRETSRYQQSTEILIRKLHFQRFCHIAARREISRYQKSTELLIRKPALPASAITVALREIRRYQTSTELLIRNLPFQRLVREDGASRRPHRHRIYAYWGVYRNEAAGEAESWLAQSRWKLELDGVLRVEQDRHNRAIQRKESIIGRWRGWDWTVRSSNGDITPLFYSLDLLKNLVSLSICEGDYRIALAACAVQNESRRNDRHRRAPKNVELMAIDVQNAMKALKERQARTAAATTTAPPPRRSRSREIELPRSAAPEPEMGQSSPFDTNPLATPPPRHSSPAPPPMNSSPPPPPPPQLLVVRSPSPVSDGLGGFEAQSPAMPQSAFEMPGPEPEPEPQEPEHDAAPPPPPTTPAPQERGKKRAAESPLTRAPQPQQQQQAPIMVGSQWGSVAHNIQMQDQAHLDHLWSIYTNAPSGSEEEARALASWQESKTFALRLQHMMEEAPRDWREQQASGVYRFDPAGMN